MVFYRVLQLAVGHDPVRYRDLVADSQSKKTPPTPPGARGHPPSLERPRQPTGPGAAHHKQQPGTHSQTRPRSPRQVTTTMTTLTVPTRRT
jgi:hypothetical protein